LIGTPPIRVQFRNSSLARGVKVDRKDLCELFDTQRPNGNRETVEERIGMFSACRVDVPQYLFVRLVQGFG
jgi:hypothetical protein